MDNMEERQVEKVSWIVKRYGEYGRKWKSKLIWKMNSEKIWKMRKEVGWIVKWYGKYGRQLWNMENMEERQVEMWKDMKNMEETEVE